MVLNGTTILTSVITSVINGVAIFLATRYTAKMVEKIEGKSKNGKKE